MQSKALWFILGSNSERLSTIHNQDDCLAINKGSNIVFQRNTCIGGHGISVVSVHTTTPVHL